MDDIEFTSFLWGLVIVVFFIMIITLVLRTALSSRNVYIDNNNKFVNKLSKSYSMRVIR